VKYRPRNAAGYMSGLEQKVAEGLNASGCHYSYEEHKLYYTIPARQTYYKPDFILWNGIVIEVKGEFDTSDRKKHRLIKEQYPDLDVRFVFSNSNRTIGKKSLTTYGKWCRQMGIPFCTFPMNEGWMLEKPCPKRIKALQEVTDWRPQYD